jgi:hypothetical protein
MHLLNHPFLQTYTLTTVARLIGLTPSVPKGMRHVNIHENTIREAHIMNEVAILHIPGASNPAELFTKEFKSDSTFRHLRPYHILSFFLPTCFVSLLGWGVSIPKFQNSKFLICPRSHSVLHYLRVLVSLLTI